MTHGRRWGGGHPRRFAFGCVALERREERGEDDCLWIYWCVIT